MKFVVGVMSLFSALGCVAPENLGLEASGGPGEAIRATEVTVDVPWDGEDVRLQAKNARLGGRDALELEGDVRFHWKGRLSGRADRAEIDVGRGRARLEGGVRASIAIGDHTLPPVGGVQ